ncbi:hypothetical protein BDU57DRAFT_230563 [Ampelomyces quisqualis]|uniref:Uncharacterized protein n=1 Tax=Ampelomyces quisqualis TaxID=50730 RepID=A0A6A5QNV4_AMPQU|nr:hypothetical protein BDU57DRAFT_230563 [Ampelomyces quisqualis]
MWCDHLRPSDIILGLPTKSENVITGSTSPLPTWTVHIAPNPNPNAAVTLSAMQHLKVYPLSSRWGRVGFVHISDYRQLFRTCRGSKFCRRARSMLSIRRRIPWYRPYQTRAFSYEHFEKGPSSNKNPRATSVALKTRPWYALHLFPCRRRATLSRAQNTTTYTERSIAEAIPAV